MKKSDKKSSIIMQLSLRSKNLDKYYRVINSNKSFIEQRNSKILKILRKDKLGFIKDKVIKIIGGQEKRYLNEELPILISEAKNKELLLPDKKLDNLTAGVKIILTSPYFSDKLKELLKKEVIPYLGMRYIIPKSELRRTKRKAKNSEKKDTIFTPFKRLNFLSRIINDLVNYLNSYFLTKEDEGKTPIPTKKNTLQLTADLMNIYFSDTQLDFSPHQIYSRYLSKI